MSIWWSIARPEVGAGGTSPWLTVVCPVTVAPVSAPYRPGQSPWPENQPQRPDRPPPIQFHEEPASGGGSSALDWTLRIVGLVAVAVISGFVWWFLTNDSGDQDPTGYGNTPSEESGGGEFDFTAELDQPVEDDSCGEHAYGQIKDFLNRKPCELLTRGIYSTSIDGRTVFTSVSVVRMADEGLAKELRDLTDTENTGNVNDLVREGEVSIDGLETLSAGGGYDSSQDGTDVVIVESDYDPAARKGGSEDELDRVCSDAIRLAAEMVGSSG
jgi:hypothetical protein